MKHIAQNNRAGMRITGQVEIIVQDARTGCVLSRQRIKYLVVTAGLNLIRDRLSGSGNALSHFATGTGATAVNPAQTALVTEVTREAITQTITTTPAQLTVKYYMATGVGNGNTLAEVGVFNAAAAGTMFARAKLSSTIAKTSAITITFTWTFTLSAT